MSCRPSQCLDRVFVKEVVIGRCGVASAAGTRLVSFRIENPSVRLHLTVHMFARPNKTGAGVGGQAHTYTGENWQLYSVAEGTPAVRTNAVFTDPSTGLAAVVQLPDTYEGETGVKAIEGDVNLVANSNGSDDYVVQCIWEPGEGGERMTDQEWGKLTALCEVKLEGNVVLSVG